MVAIEYQNEAKLIGRDGRRLVDDAVSAGGVLVEIPLVPRLSTASTMRPATEEGAQTSTPLRRATLVIERRFDVSGLTDVLVWPATNHDAQQLRDWSVENAAKEG